MKGSIILRTLIPMLLAGSLLSCNRQDIFGMADGTPPATENVIATTAPASGHWIASTGLNKEIIIEFSSSMNTATLQLAGTLGPEASATWTSLTRENDTVTLTPSASWTIGSDLSMQIQCSTVEGTSVTLDLIYQVAGSLRYVSISSGSANETGTRDEPYKDIQSAMGNISGTVYPGVVLVAAGTYGKAGTVITMEAGISLYGGYSASDWNIRDTQNHATVLRNTRNSVEPGDSTGDTINPFNTIDISGSSIGRETILDGFAVYAAPLQTNNHGTYTRIASTVININSASPSITNNTINGNSSLSQTDIVSSGFNITGLNTALISGNTITGGSNAVGPQNGTESLGIYIENNSSLPLSTVTEITGNNIHGGAGGISKAIVLQNASPTISNNPLITAQAATNAFGIQATSNSSPVISGNTISGLFGSSSTRGIQLDASSTSADISSNNITDLTGPTVYGIQIDNSSNPSINGNTISKLTGTATVYGIQINNTSSTISGNTILTLSGPAAYGIKISTATPPAAVTSTISKNTIDGLSGTSIWGIEAAGTDLTTTFTDNTIRNFTTTGDQPVYGFYVANLNPALSQNNIQNLDASGGTGFIYGIYVTGSGSVGDIHHNTISGIQGNSTQITFGICDSGTNSNIYDNIITDFTGNEIHGVRFANSSTSTAYNNTISALEGAGRVTGMHIHSSSTPVIKKNIIGPFTSNDASGIFINNAYDGSPVKIFNNVINAGTGTNVGSGTKGIWIYTDITFVHIRNNTINGGGAGTETNMTSTAIELRNDGAAAWHEVLIENNLLFTDNNTTYSYGIHEYPDSAEHRSYPTGVKNNNIFNCQMLYSDIADNEVSITPALMAPGNISLVNQINDLSDSMQYDGNIEDNIYGADFTWASLYKYSGDFTGRIFHTSGLNGSSQSPSWSFGDDHAGSPRPSIGSNWSIGAFEYN